MSVIPGNAQHIGDRERQEDAFGFSSLGDRAFEHHAGVMMVLCDGMGGLANGAAASRAAVDAALGGYWRKQASEHIPSALDRALREAHQAVCEICGEGGTAGSTIVVAVVWQDKLYWASLGDSRLYLCRNGAAAVQLTKDDNVASLLEQRVTQGESSVKEAVSASAPPDALTAYLGAPYPPQPQMGRDVTLQPGDRIIACSDGLYRGLSPEAMAAIARHGDPMLVAERMITAVLKQQLPHQDNLTVALLEVSSPSRRLIEIFQTPGPIARGALYGFGLAVLLAIILTIFGVLRFSPADRQTNDTAAPPQISSDSFSSQTGGAGLPAASAGGGQPPTGTSQSSHSSAGGSAPPEKRSKVQPAGNPAGQTPNGDR
jgi:PPM family protein phosphatase